MLAAEACRDDTGFFKNFSLTEEEKYELHIAAWLHDCGKIVTPVHIMDKATKLETIFDRIDIIRARLETRRLRLSLDYLEAMAKGTDKTSLTTEYERALAQCDDDMAFIETANMGSEFMADENIVRLKQLAQTTVEIGGKTEPLLTEN